jgi:formimidoylglutamate deiminase
MYKLVDSLDSKAFLELSKRSFEEMVRSGITTVGEFHYFHHDRDKTSPPYAFDQVILQAAKEAGIRIVLLETYYARGGFEVPLSQAQQRFKTSVILGSLKWLCQHFTVCGGIHCQFRQALQ